MSSKDDVLQQFKRDGYAIFRDVLDSGLVHEASRHLNWLQEKNPELRPEQYHHPLVADDPFWVRLVSDERLVDIAEIFVGPNIALFASPLYLQAAVRRASGAVASGRQLLAFRADGGRDVMACGVMIRPRRTGVCV